jgi:ATP-dependent exoDNAse (exonuclease V) alpha subunit
MVTVNIDVSDGLANGACGSVVGIDNTNDTVHVILVEFDNRRVGLKAITESQYRQTYPTAVPIKRHNVQFYTGRGRRSVQAQRTQFPLTLAWACTIHKVQGNNNNNHLFNHARLVFTA